MAIEKCKGTLLKLDISGTLTTVAQCIELTPPKDKSLDFEAETLDQTGVGTPRELTGGTDSDAMSAMLFWDPALAVHAAIHTAISTPAKTTWQIALADTGTTSYDYTCAGLEFGGVIGARDGLKAELSGNVDGLPVIS